MSSIVAELVRIEKRRLRALVDVDAELLDALHAPEFVLIHPGGGAWTKETYIGDVLSGAIDYRRFDAVSAIEGDVEGGLAVLRYRSVIDIDVQGQEAGLLECWHTDCYRAAAEGPWRVVWSQATEIR